MFDVSGTRLSVTSVMPLVNMPKTLAFTAFLSLCTTYVTRMLDVSGTRCAVTSSRDCREHIENAGLYVIFVLPTTYCVG